MQPSEWDFESKVEEDKDDVAQPETPEERVDRFGIRTALVVLGLAFFIAVMWLVSTVQGGGKRRAVIGLCRYFRPTA